MGFGATFAGAGAAHKSSKSGPFATVSLNVLTSCTPALEAAAFTTTASVAPPSYFLAATDYDIGSSKFPVFSG